MTARAVLSVLLPGTPCEPHRCNTCAAVVRRFRSAERADKARRVSPPCRRRTCDGVLWPAPDAWRISLREVLAATVRTYTARDHHEENGAPGVEPGTPPQQAAPLGGDTAMTTIIQRHARDLHAGDVITHDPDHDRPVRWRVLRPPARAGSGEYSVCACTDEKTGQPVYAYFKALTNLSVEPAGGAA